jgi:transposase
MPNYKPVERGMMLLAVDFAEQIIPGSFEFTLNHLVDQELDLSGLDARFKNDQTGASAYDPRVMLKIVLLAYSRGIISSRAIAQACEKNIVFMALGGDSRPSYTHIAKFVRELGDDIKPLFTQVLMTCDSMGLIGKELFAIDGVKLPSNASKERSGTHAELLHRADRLDKAAAKIIERHREQDEGKTEQPLDARRQAQVARIRKEAQTTREFVARTQKKTNAKGVELKSNVTDNDSAKMLTNKGAIQGYAAQAAVDDKHQVIVAADVLGLGSEQAALLPMVQLAQKFATEQTLMVADAGYNSEANLVALEAQNIPALIADNGMRKRDERYQNQGKHKAKPEPLHDKRAQRVDKIFRPEDFKFNGDGVTCVCPAGKELRGSGNRYVVNGFEHFKYKAAISDCAPCQLRRQCLIKPETTQFRQVGWFPKGQISPKTTTQKMRQAIDSPRGRTLYSKRIGAVEPVFGNLRHNKQLNRFTLRGKRKVNAQWHLYCLVHNIGKIASI